MAHGPIPSTQSFYQQNFTETQPGLFFSVAILCYSDRVEKLQQRQCDLQSLKYLYIKEVCQSLI